jgi:hypothetical protein
LIGDDTRACSGSLCGRHVNARSSHQFLFAERPGTRHPRKEHKAGLQTQRLEPFNGVKSATVLGPSKMPLPGFAAAQSGHGWLASLARVSIAILLRD